MDGNERETRKEGKTVDIMLDATNQHGTMCQISCPHGLPNELLAMERNLLMLDASNQHGTMCQISCPRGLPDELLGMERNLLVGISGLECAGEGLFLEP